MSFFNNKKAINNALFACILIYPWLFHVFQGLDVPELGYWLVGYENFFSNPEVAQTTFYSWLTTFLGAIVNVFVGDWGVIGYKIANVFSVYSILYVIYKILEDCINKMKIEILGTLTNLYIPVSNYNVYPTVGFCNSEPKFKIV